MMLSPYTTLLRNMGETKLTVRLVYETPLGGVSSPAVESHLLLHDFDRFKNCCRDANLGSERRIILISEKQCLYINRN